MSPLGLGLILALVGFVSSADFSCNGEENYEYPVDGDCRLFYVCSKGSSTPRQESCSWLFQNFDPINLTCTWCWKVDCSATPAPPPTAPPPTTTSTAAPSSSTAAPSSSTAAPSSSTAAPSSSTAAPSSSTAATSAAPAKAAKAKHLHSLMINRLKRH